MKASVVRKARATFKVKGLNKVGYIYAQSASHLDFWLS